MGYGLVDNNTLSNIANAIREKANSNSVYYPSEMPLAIRQIETGGNGFSTPVVRSTLPWASLNVGYSSEIGYNYQGNNGLINTYLMQRFEFTNNLDENANIIAKVDWESYSKGNVFLYEKDNNTVFGLYTDGNHLANDISIIDMTGLCKNAYNYSGDAFCTPLTQVMDSAFGGLAINNAACGEYVKSLRYTYYGCYRIAEAICGNSVTDMTGAYMSCTNIQNGVCGPEVIKMAYAYSADYKLKNLQIGEKVTNIKYIANACNNLINVYGDCNNVTDGEYAFQFDYRLETIPLMRKIVTGNYMFNGCSNLTNNTVYEFTNKTRYLKEAYAMFCGCGHAESVFIWNNLVNAGSMFKGCSNLVHVQSEATNLKGVVQMFADCYNLVDIIEFPASLNSIQGMYMNCYNLSCDVEIPEWVTTIGNAFYKCENILNAAILTNNFYSTSWMQFNTFYRTDYTRRRNIVTTNLNTFVNFLAFNCAGNWTKTYDNSTETEVFVNEKSYNCVRCAYNTTYNCYVYCTE